jgi:hypothetical protein
VGRTLVEVIVVKEKRIPFALVYGTVRSPTGEDLWEIVRAVAEGRPREWLVERTTVPGVETERLVEVIIDGTRVLGDPLRPNIITLGSGAERVLDPVRRGGWFMHPAPRVDVADEPEGWAEESIRSVLDDLPDDHPARAHLLRALEALPASDD